MSIKKRVGGIFVIIISLILFVACTEGTSDQTDNEGASISRGGEQTNEQVDLNFSWGSGTLGSSPYVMIEGMASIANKYLDFQNSSVSTAGSLENLLLVSEGEIDFGSVSSDTLYNAYNGNEPFDKKVDFSQVFAFTFWTVPLVTPVDSGIETVEDLVGKTVDIGTLGKSSSVIWKAIFDEYGITDQVTIEAMGVQEGVDALRSKQIDAHASSHLSGDQLTPALQELANSMEFRPVEIDQTVLEKVVEKNDGLTIELTSKDTTSAYTQDVSSPATTGILVTRQDMDEDVVYELTKTLLEHEDEVRDVAVELKLFGKDYAVKGLIKDYPIHPGALKYFQEIGIWEE